MNLARKEFENMKNNKRIYENDIRIRFIGHIELFPKDIQKTMNELMENTKNHKTYTVNIAAAYGGRMEMVDAARKLAKDIENGKLKPEQVNEKTFRKYLYMDDEPELIIRTGGEKRTSNFLIFQGAYAEWFFLEKLWPEFEKEDLVKVIDEYKQRDRRFGK